MSMCYVDFRVDFSLLLGEIIIIIMVIFNCYFSREHIALSYKNGLDIELGKTIGLKAL